jgi:polyprenyl-phospho-N-acetylgalactosaminyl synthase
MSLEAPRLAEVVHSTWVVIPAYNEQGSIRGVVTDLLTQGYHVAVVDDGSSQMLEDAVRGLGCFVLRHAINLGQGAALQTGIAFALQQGARYVVTFDADGQHQSSDIPALLEPLVRGHAQVALGSRFLAGGRAVNIPASRRLLLRAATAFTRLTTGLALTDTHNGLRAFNRAAAAELRITQNGMAHASQILDEVKAHRWAFCEVPVTLLYTEYSQRKGQRASNAVNILWESFSERFYR